MRIHWRQAILGLAVAAVIGLPSSAFAQYGFPGYGGGYGGYGGFGGYGGYGGGLGNQQQLLQQLPPNNLRNNYYFYDSIGGMGRTGGTVQVVTQFGLQSQQQNNVGSNVGIGGYGGGYGGFPGYYGVNYQRRLMQAQLAAAYAYQAQANAYRQNQMNTAPTANPTAPYSSYTPSATPQFGSFGFANSSVRTGFGAFNAQTFQAKKDDKKEEPKEQEKNKEQEGKDK